MSKRVMITTTIPTPCKHLNGWWVSVKFWIFKRIVYVCSDCGEVEYKRAIRGEGK